MKINEMKDRLNKADLKDANVWARQLWIVFLSAVPVYFLHEDGFLLTLTTPEAERGFFASSGWVVDALIVYLLFYIMDMLGDHREALRLLLDAQSDTEDK